LSDVVFGATIGVLFGRAGFKHHFTVAPMAWEPTESSAESYGLSISWSF
jgi:hypothetical protein